MRCKNKDWIIFLIIFITVVFPIQEIYPQSFSVCSEDNKDKQQSVSLESNTSDSIRLEGQLKRLNVPQRVFRLKPDLVVKALKIKQGMHILDVGAGNGFFTFRFAEALKNSGHVFATEISQGLINELNKGIAEKNYQNVTSVLVQKEGLDPFYKNQSFDIIFLGNVFYHLWHHEEYFRELSPSLKKDGRLFIIQPKPNYDFDKITLHNQEELMSRLKVQRGDISIIYERLSKEIKLMIEAWSIKDPVPDKFQDLLIENLNQMLSDKKVLNDILEYYYEISGDNPWIDLYKNNREFSHLLIWLKHDLDENRFFETDAGKMDEMDEWKLRRINSIIICLIFNIKPSDTVVYVQKINTIILIMDKAGYRFIKNYDFLKKHYFLEFIKQDVSRQDELHIK